MVYSFPENEKLWSEYAELRADSLGRREEEHEAQADTGVCGGEGGMTIDGGPSPRLASNHFSLRT
jgi:hypothetical protein